MLIRILLTTFAAIMIALPAVITGPAVGSHVPDFEAPDQNGQPHNLRSLLGPKGAILVFYRSADW